MNVGEQTVEWLYKDKLKVDDEWSVQTAGGFCWWAHRHAQAIEVVAEEKLGDETGYVISVRTDFLRDFEPKESDFLAINGMLMSFASMAGPVYDAVEGTLGLHSLVRVHRGISSWMNNLIAMAAVMQLAEVEALGGEMASAMNAQDATSEHPRHGTRPVPDEMLDAASMVIVPLGQQPCRWPEGEFEDVVAHYLRRPPSLGGSGGGRGYTVEFPYGAGSSLCQVNGGERHPRYGNGLFQLQRFPVAVASDSEGAALALALNGIELVAKPSGYGFGSYCYQDGTINFTSFFPNVLYRPGLLPNIYFASATRARDMSGLLMARTWDKGIFSPGRSAYGRLFDELKKARRFP